MKAIKLIIVALVAIAIVGVMIWISNDESTIKDPELKGFAKNMAENYDRQWNQSQGWNDSIYSGEMSDIKRHEEQKLITAKDALQLKDHVNLRALEKTNARLNDLYSHADCLKSEVDAQYAGIKMIAQSPNFKDDEAVKRQQGIYAVYSEALKFASSQCGSAPGFSMPYSWRSFSSYSSAFKQRAANIRSNQYYDVIKDITAVKGGMNAVDSKISSAHSRYRSSLAASIRSAYRNAEKTEANLSNLEACVRKYNNENPGNGENLSSFEREFSRQIDSEKK